MASAAQASEATNPSTKTVWKDEITVIGVAEDRMAPTTAAAEVVPKLRIKALSPFAAAVSVCGTEAMIWAGIAA